MLYDDATDPKGTNVDLQRLSLAAKGTLTVAVRIRYTVAEPGFIFEIAPSVLLMISPKLYRKSRTYDFFMKSFGYSTSIERFLSGLTLDLPKNARILDAGCGTGILGIHFLERHADASLLATDLEPNFLRATLCNAEQRGIEKGRISVGVADISAPRNVVSLEGESMNLADSSFDLICIGAVVGYAEDIEASLRELVSMLSPGGYFVNVEMNDSLTGRFVSHRYHYRNIPLSRMQDVMRLEGCELTVSKLGLHHLPAKLTRTGFIARKAGGNS